MSRLERITALNKLANEDMSNGVKKEGRLFTAYAVKPGEANIYECHANAELGQLNRYRIGVLGKFSAMPSNEVEVVLDNWLQANLDGKLDKKNKFADSYYKKYEMPTWEEVKGLL